MQNFITFYNDLNDDIPVLMGITTRDLLYCIPSYPLIILAIFASQRQQYILLLILILSFLILGGAGFALSRQKIAGLHLEKYIKNFLKYKFQTSKKEVINEEKECFIVQHINLENEIEQILSDQPFQLQEKCFEIYKRENKTIKKIGYIYRGTRQNLTN